MPRQTAGTAGDPQPWARPMVILTSVFILSRVLYYSLGVRFDMTPLSEFHHIIDPVLLKERLLESLYYFSLRMPLLNLLIGTVLKFFSGHEAFVFHAVYLALGYMMAVSLYWLLREGLRTGRTLSLVLTLVFVASPSCVLHENLLFDTYPLTVLLCVSAFLLNRFLRRRRSVEGLLFFSCLSLMALTRNLFHLFWFVGILAVLVYFQRHDRVKTVKLALIPLLVVLSLYVKNTVVFGNISGSSMMGCSLACFTTFQLPEAERVGLVGQGKISVFGLFHPFPTQKYFEVYEKNFGKVGPTGIPVLDQGLDSTGRVNYNCLEIRKISEIYGQDAVYVLGHYPETYLRGIRSAVGYFFLPASDLDYLQENKKRMGWIPDLFDMVFCGRWPGATGPGIVLIIAVPALLLFGLWQASKALATGPRDATFALTLLFIWANTLFVTVGCNAFEILENNRYRFMIDPLFVALAGSFLVYRFNVNPGSGTLVPEPTSSKNP